MSFSGPGIFLALISFAATFFVARTLGKWWRSRNAQRKQEIARAGESRQVRRARQRGKS